MLLGVVTDLHWTARPGGDAAWHNPYDLAGLAARVRAAADWFRTEGVAAVAVLGDVGNGGHAEEHEPALALLAEAGPLLVVPGNHDLGVRPDALRRAAGALGERAAVAPFVRTLGDLVVLGVDLASEDGGLTSRGALPRAQGTAAGRLVLSHYPLVSQAAHLAGRGFAYPGDLLNRQELEPGGGEGPTLVLHGHLHARIVHRAGAVLQLGFAALVEHPAEAAVLEVAVEDGDLRVAQQVRSLATLPHVRTPVLTQERAWRLGEGGWCHERL